MAGRDSDDDHDRDGWRAWLDRHGPALLLYARQWAGSRRADAEDAVQTAFVNFWPRRSTASDPTAYLFACVRSAALNLARSHTRRLKHERPADAPDPLFVPDPDTNLRRQAVEEALAHLPPDQREILVLKIWSDLTFAQIAAVLGISPNTAASRYRYALTKLESLLSQEARP